MDLYRKLLRKLAHFQVSHPFITILFVLSITLALYGGVPMVKTVASLEQMMPKQVDEIQAFNTLRDTYLGQDMIAVVVQINRQSTDPNGIVDIRDKKVIEYIEHLKILLEGEHDIRVAYAGSDVLLYASGKDSVSDLSSQEFEMYMANPDVKNQLSNFVNDDSTISIIMATTDISADDPRMLLLASRVKEDIVSAGYPPGIEVKLTGTPIIQQKLGELISRDRKSTQLISTIFVFLITMTLFGTFTSALVPIAIVTLSVNWLYGIMGYTNLPISTLAGGVAAMVIGIGIDYAIHLMNKFKNERKAGRSVALAVEAAVQDTGVALTGAAVATVLAFLAFLLGSMPEMNRFGLLMAIGVGSAFILSIFGLPALLIIEERIVHSLKKRLHFGVEGELSLYDKNEVHPDTHTIYEPTEVELRHLVKKYKVCKPKSPSKSKTKGRNALGRVKK